ncbi:cysteine desulfurase family protein [Paenibacillus ginsengihumi]|uniref:cysteine desulfurase family protein n=1 Tax=Paenibacillus ginsengihumi TaxID=431596 RepID=UPI0003739341|nr:cysteine desulfurase family protein [Paenibacillus ginsengihumi]
MLYFDHAASSPMYEEVIETMAEVMKRYYGNPSSLHKAGLEAERLVRRARETIAAALHASPGEIVFTSGGTESNVLAIRGAAARFAGRGKHLVTTSIEHASVYETFRWLEKQGFRVTYLSADETGQVRLDELEKALTDETILVSVMYVNNETGRIQPVAEIGRMLKDRPKTLFHVDAVQAVGKLGVNPAAIGADLLSASAHKLRGPKGVGILYCREGLELEPLLPGGGQEGGLRSGTENVPAIVGMAKALRMAMDERQQFLQRTAAVRARLVQCIDSLPQLALTGSRSPEEMAPHIVHFSFPGMKAEVIVHALEQHGIYVSTRSACSSADNKPSRVLSAMGLDRSRAASGIRISFSAMETLDDADRLCDALRRTIELLSLKGAAARVKEKNGGHLCT